VLKRLVAGLENMHDDECRRGFLHEVGGRLDAVETWVRDAKLEDQVDARYAPTFLHGGCSTGRWVVVGINPGADKQSGGAEQRFKRASPENFVAVHEQFFEKFPDLRRNGKQPWWRKLYRVTRVFDGIVAPSVPVPWQELQECSNFVVQDLLPFHGRTSATLRRRELESGGFRPIVDATIAGLARSEARGILVCSRMGYALFRAHSTVSDICDFSLNGETKKGNPRSIAGYVARLGTVPLVALDNEIIAQPKFRYEKLLPNLLAVLGQHDLVCDKQVDVRFLASDREGDQANTIVVAVGAHEQ
jgi:hypothetical protein